MYIDIHIGEYLLSSSKGTFWECTLLIFHLPLNVSNQIKIRKYCNIFQLNVEKFCTDCFLCVQSNPLSGLAFVTTHPNLSYYCLGCES